MFSSWWIFDIQGLTCRFRVAYCIVFIIVLHVWLINYLLYLFIYTSRIMITIYSTSCTERLVWSCAWSKQKQPPEVFCKKLFLKISQISQKIPVLIGVSFYWKTWKSPMEECCFGKVAGLACNIIESNTLSWLFFTFFKMYL